MSGGFSPVLSHSCDVSEGVASGANPMSQFWSRCYDAVLLFFGLPLFA